MNALSVLENLLAVLGIAGFFIAPIAWAVFIVFCFRMKNAYSDSAKRDCRIVRTVSLIVAILFTILVLIFIFAMSNGEGGVPLPTNLS